MSSRRFVQSNRVSVGNSQQFRSSETPVKEQVAYYDLPPPNYGLSNHYYHYGWPISLKMIERMLIAFQIPYPPQTRSRFPAILGRYLMQISDFRGGIKFVWCKPDDWCAEHNRVQLYAEDGEEVSYVTMFTIGCTFSKKYFWRRPTQQGLDILIEAFGERPRWMEDFNTKKEFSEDFIE